MKLFFRKEKVTTQSDAYAPYEEIDAKRTSKLGYFFLVLMVIFGVAQGQNFLGALEESINRPESNSRCLNELAQYAKSNATHDSYTYYNYQGSGPCLFSAREIALSLDDAYRTIEPLQTEITSLKNSIGDLKQQINTIERKRRQNVDDYQATLLEDIAEKESGVLDQKDIQNNITAHDASLMMLQERVGNETARLQVLTANIETLAVPYQDSIQKAYDGYIHDIHVYEFKQFLLSFVFIAPLFCLAWYLYHRSRRVRSEYAIIWGGILATVSLIFAQILLVFVYEIIPREFLAKIFELIRAMELLLAVFYWLGFILVPLFFGLLIYFIQKKFYNKRAVMMRALKSEHCPNCSLKINHTMNNCPVCGYVLKTKCTVCSGMSMDGGAFCQVCGARRTPPSTGV